MLIDNENCYVSGWGRTLNDKGSLGISQNLKYGYDNLAKTNRNFF